MVSLVGLHMRSNGIKQYPARVVTSLNGAGLGGDETHADTITVLRDTRAFPDGEAPPDWRTYDGSDWPAFGEYWYGIHDAYWQLNPADYYQITNEQGGGEGADVEGNYIQLVKVERTIMQAANADGRKCCVLNLAGGSPGDFELWKQICAPFIVEAWENGGNIYGRHCYADKLVNDDGSIVPGQPQRVIDELEYLRSIGYGGGMVLTECGLYGGYGVANYGYFEQQVTRWEAALRPYADILIGLCWWETGASEFNADYTAHLKQVEPKLYQGLPRWQPPTPPGNGGNMTTYRKNDIVGMRGWQDHKLLSAQIRILHGNGEATDFVTFDIPGIDSVSDVRGIEIKARLEGEIPDENLNPPPVVSNPLPQGALFMDVSANNALVDVAKVKSQGVQGIGIRLSNGIRKSTDTTDENGIDKRAWYYMEQAKINDMPWLGYHFSNENYDDVEQVQHFLNIANLAIADGHIPEMGLFIDFETPQAPIQGSPTTEPRIQQQLTTLTNERPSFILDYGPYTSKGWWDSKVPNADTWVSALGLKLWASAWVPEGTLVNGWPPEWWKPFTLKGFDSVYYWQWTSKGGFEVGHSVDSLDLNFVGDTAVVPNKPPTPPQGKTVDILPYFVPANTYGRYMVMHFDDGRTQPQQLERRGDTVYLWKGEGWVIDGQTVYDYESWGVDLKKWVDTSDQGNNGRDAYNLNGVVWLPRFVEIGKVYISTPTVTRFDRITCNVISELQTTDYLYAKALYPTWTSPKNANITLENVLLIEWRKTPDINTPPLESYFLAPDMCYCAWQNAAIGELPEGRQPLSFKLTDCE